MEWTRRQIRELAPNDLISRKGKSLSSSESWETFGGNGKLLWGRCKSTGELLYQVAVNLQEPRFRCDCAAQLQPCRHIIGLLFYFLQSAGQHRFDGQAPSWATGLLRQPATYQLSEEEKNRRKAERQQRFGKRLHSMMAGLDELERWLFDLVQQGFSTTTNYDYGFWDKFAARMQDAKLGGIARRIRRIYQLQQQDDWHVKLLEELAQLFLFVQSFRQLEDLPQPLQEDVLSIAGINKKQEEILKLPGVKDHWLVVGLLDSEEDNLYLRKSYLIGSRSGRIALVMSYNYGSPRFDFNWPAGSAVEGEIVYYPGTFPYRALARKTKPSRQALTIKDGFADLSVFAEGYASALAANPWLSEFPAVLSEVRAARHKNRLYLVDKKEQALPLAMSEASIWSLLAMSADKVLTVFGLWDGSQFTPISALAQERVLSLQGAVIDFSEEDFEGI